MIPSSMILVCRAKGTSTAGMTKELMVYEGTPENSKGLFHKGRYLHNVSTTASAALPESVVRMFTC